MKFELQNKEINKESLDTVCARELHKELESKQQFSNWIISRIEQTGFSHGVDFININNSIYTPARKEYYLTIDAAKHIAMMERNEKGKEARQYFIDVEKSLISKLPKNFAEALRLAADQQESIIKLEASNKIKDDYVIASNKASIESGDIKVSEFCKSSNILDIGKNKMYDWLRDQGYLFKGSREPIQRFVGMGIFRWLPTDEKNGGKYRYTLYITARGKIYLAEKYLNYLDESCKK